LSRPIIKSHTEEKVGVAWARELPKIWGFPFNISAMSAAIATSNLVHSLGFAKAHHKITPRGKVGVALYTVSQKH